MLDFCRRDRQSIGTAPKMVVSDPGPQQTDAPTPIATGHWAAPEIWVILTHAVGDNEQCLALAEMLGRPFRCVQVDWTASNRAADRAQLEVLLRDDVQGRKWRSSIGLHAPWPRLIICSGRRADDLALWIKRRSDGRSKVVTIGRAHGSLADYDLIVASPQYLLPERDNVVRLPNAMTRDRAEIFPEALAAPILAPKPWFTILLGGRVKQFIAGEAALRQAAVRAQLSADRTGGSVIVSTSRRTPSWLLAAVESELTAPTIYRWSRGTTDNPYATLLQKSAAVFVTGDSASMIQDACRSGTPTYLIELPDRIDIRRLGRRSFYNLIRAAAGLLRESGLEDMAGAVDRAQEWLHARRILRFPRDLRRVHSTVYEMGLARPAADFDPSAIPARRGADRSLDASAMEAVVERCMAWF